jgi:arylsulfatase A-like enzyme
MIISGPKIPKAQTSQALVYLFDLFPTLIDYLNLKEPENIDGESLMDIINKKEKYVRSSLYTAYRNTVRAVRNENWKLIYYPQINVKQLYNLKEDHNELNNLAKKSAYKTKIKEMMDLLQFHRIATDDTINLYPSRIQSKEYDYKDLVQKLDPWQPAYIIDKYFPKGTTRD